MERPQSVPAEAVFNTTINEWELGRKNGIGENVGEWKYWSAVSGYYSCQSILDESSGITSFSRFHPDGTYSQKGTFVNGVAEGKMYFQKSEHPTEELALTELEYANIFRATCIIKDGVAIWWDYFNKENEPVHLQGGSNLTLDEFAQIFPDFLVPTELVMLLAFEQRYGCELYAQNFNLSAYSSAAIASYSKDPEFLKRFTSFASANGSGSFYSIWDNGSGRPLNEMPIVVFGDEGGVHVVATDVLQLIQLLTCDSAIGVDHASACFYYNDEEDEASPYAQEYKDWVKSMFNLDPINDSGGDAMIKDAQDKFKESFDTWFNQYVSH